MVGVAAGALLLDAAVDAAKGLSKLGHVSEKSKDLLKDAWVSALGPKRKTRPWDSVPGTDGANGRVAKELVEATINPYVFIREAQNAYDKLPSAPKEGQASEQEDLRLTAYLAGLRSSMAELSGDAFESQIASMAVLAAARGQWDERRREDWRAVLPRWGFGTGTGELEAWAAEVAEAFVDEVRNTTGLASYVVAIDSRRRHQNELVDALAKAAAAEALASIARTARLARRAMVLALTAAVVALGLDATNLVEVSKPIAELLRRIGD